LAGSSQDLDKDEESRMQSPAYVMDHCYARPVVDKKKKEPESPFENQFANDHGYSRCSCRDSS
jgi:hypothetical protein